MLLMQPCFFRKDMHKDLLVKCNKMRKKNTTTNHTKPAIGFFSSCLSGKLCGLKPPVHLSAFMATPPVAFLLHSAG